MYQDLHVVDFHAHFPTEAAWFGSGVPDIRQQYPERVGEDRAKIARQYAMAYTRDWRLAWDFEPPEENPPDDIAQGERWAAEIDRYGLRAVAFVTGGGNDNLAAVVSRFPTRFVGFAHHYLFAENAPDELQRAVNDLGLRGYKLLAPALDRPITDRAGYPVWEVCAELDIPVLIHFGILGGGGGIAWHENINPLILHDVAKDFPDVKFIIPHFGCGWIRETLHLAWACRNVCVDTSGSNQWTRWMDGNWTTKKLFRKYLDTIGPERLLFGTDSSYFPRGFAIRYLKDQIRDLRELNVCHEHLQMIFGYNAAQILKIDLDDYPAAP